MTEKEAKILQQLRSEIGDKSEPYLHLDDELLSMLYEAVRDYSKYEPRTLRETIAVIPRKEEYALPDVYQTWVNGLAGYEVFDRTLYISPAPPASYEIKFIYLADHTLDSVPERDWNLLIDYAMWKLLDGIVREGAEISGLKLGKGLDIRFDNFDKIADESKRRFERYQSLIKKPIGRWG